MGLDGHYRAGTGTGQPNRAQQRRYYTEMRAYLGISKPRYVPYLQNFRFQFPCGFQPRREQCSGNYSCAYPPLFSGKCREHYADQFALISWTRMHTGKSWRRTTVKAFSLADLELMRKADEQMRAHAHMLGVKGIDHPQGVLTDEEVLAIREEIARGDSLLSTAEKYGVSRSLISVIARGDHRADLGGPFTEFTSDQRSQVSKRVAVDMWNQRRLDSGKPLPPDDVPLGMSWCCDCGKIFAEAWFSASQLRRTCHGRRCRPCLQEYQRLGRIRRGWKPAEGPHPFRNYPKHKQGDIEAALCSIPFKRTNPGLYVRSEYAASPVPKETL